METSEASETSLVVGATGLIGARVVERLLSDPGAGRVVVLARRPTGRSHERLTEHVVDFDALDRAKSAFAGVDAVYVCLGTTRKAAGSRERFRRVDHDYAVAVASLAREAGARKLALVSSVGASARSGNFYLRVKGETEDDLRALGFPTLVLARPSLLLGDRDAPRAGEAVGALLGRALSWTLMGGLRAYRPIEADDVAAGLIAALGRVGPGVHVLTYDALRAR